jgi:phosphoglycolate phosphatase
LIQFDETSSAPGPAGPVGFDLDLTLIDSQPAILAAWREVARETGARIDLDSVTRRMGIKLEDEAAFWFPAEEREAAVATYRRHYVRLALQLTTPLPGAGESLAAVRRAGERAIIITAKHPVSVGPSLTAAGLEPDDLYTHVYGPEKAAVLTQLGAAVYVGDAPADMGAATAAGAHAVGVATGSFSAADLRAAGAEVVLDSLREFPAWYAAFRRPEPR